MTEHTYNRRSLRDPLTPADDVAAIKREEARRIDVYGEPSEVVGLGWHSDLAREEMRVQRLRSRAQWMHDQMAAHNLSVSVVARRAGLPQQTVRRALAGAEMPWGIELKLSVAVTRHEPEIVE